MTDRERLVLVLKRAKNNCLIKESGGCLSCTHRGKADCTIENIADILFGVGIIVPPIKGVDNKLYIHQYNNEWKLVVVECEVIKYDGEQELFHVKLADGRKLNLPFYYVGKTVFLTKEEAEQALKERV